MVAYGLEVTADEQQVDFVGVFLFEGGDVGVDCVEFAVAASFDRDLYDVSFDA
jgi:hypothetical protein